MLKVLIVDDEAVVRRGIVLGVDWASMGCVVVGEAPNGEEGIAAAEQYESYNHRCAHAENGRHCHDAGAAPPRQPRARHHAHGV